MDYKKLFAKAVYEEMCEAFERHGIDAIYEDELEELVIDITNKYFMQTVDEFKRAYGVPRVVDVRPSSMFGRGSLIGGSYAGGLRQGNRRA